MDGPDAVCRPGKIALSAASGKRITISVLLFAIGSLAATGVSFRRVGKL